ncbi:MAG TPA: tyrosine--tRNA ligase, partial [Proteobacteria bacterium]|nr:tyrosine--tRNA ligase [Pseudomonadota bacterium]
MADEVQRQLEIIKQGCVEVIEEDELKRKLEFSISSNVPLTVKAGFDPSAP